jgi:repressor LexA
MMRSLTERQQAVLQFLKRYLREHGFPPTVREIARHFGMAGPKGAKKHLDALVKKGSIERVARLPRAIQMRGAVRQQGRLLPILGTVRAGMPLLSEENIEGHFWVDENMAPQEGAFFLRVKGDSMIEAHVQEGDYVMIRRQPTVENGEMAVFQIDGEMTLKYFSKKKGQIFLNPAHPRMKPIAVHEGQSFEILGKAVAVLRMLDAGIKRKEKESRGI